MEICIYQPADQVRWDSFVSDSKNGTFLFLRNYMDYHAERFHDHSLILCDDAGHIVALLPANRTADQFVSHGGLTFGGFITDNSMKTPTMLQIFEETLTFLKKKGVTKFVYKAIPHIYHRLPSEEDRYALFLCNARLIRCSALTVINSRNRLPFQERRKRGIKKAKQKGLSFCQCNDFESYWQILSDRLLRTHNASPVHSLSEIEKLRSRFPANIKLFACFQESTMLAGVLVYESDTVAHVQYIAANDLGRELSALDLLFDELITNQYKSKSFFDFGIQMKKVAATWIWD